jgi:DNA polymerase
MVIEDLTDLHEAYRADPDFRHLRTEGIRLVPGIGASPAKALVIGEAPGATENDRGEPFCGASGNVLTQLMALAGLYARPYAPGKKQPKGECEELPPNVWLTNAVKYRPPGNRTPWFTEIAASAQYLKMEWQFVGRPRLIVCVGSVAATAIGQHTPSRVRRGELYPLKDGRTWIAYQFHPAYGLRGGPERRAQMESQWETMGELIESMREELAWTR